MFLRINKFPDENCTMSAIFAGYPPVPGAGWRKKVPGPGVRSDQGSKMSVYCVNPAPAPGPGDTKDQLRRRVSRVESLRKLILGASNIDTRNVIDPQIKYA